MSKGRKRAIARKLGVKANGKLGRAGTFTRVARLLAAEKMGKVRLR